MAAHNMSKMAPTPGHHIQSRNQRALVISAILTGFYFSTVQIESSQEGEEGAEQIEFVRHEKFSP